MVTSAQKESQQRILEIAGLLLTRGPSTIDELAQALDIPKSSVHRALQTLTDAGWAHRNLSKGGRPPKLKEAGLKAARAMLADKSITVEEVAKHLRVSPATLYRHMPAARAQGTETGGEA